MLSNKRILLIISGGIAAYKSLDIIRHVREQGGRIRCILTTAARHFVSPLAIAALSEEKVFEDLFSLTDEAEMGHIRLSRESDLVLVAPASADILAKMTIGLADDLATATLLATDQLILVAPAMNPTMWAHPATQANKEILMARGIKFIGPAYGITVCGEEGIGRMADSSIILNTIVDILSQTKRSSAGPLFGRRALITSGPTYEPIDPVRFIANRSSGIQGHSLATAIHHQGAETILITGPTREPDPPDIQTIHIQTAQEMITACLDTLPVDIAICAAAVADWQVSQPARQKMKKNGQKLCTLTLIETPDILATLSLPGPRRPSLVIGFAAETEHVLRYAQEKRSRKGCDWILANDVSPSTGILGGTMNTVHFICAEQTYTWPTMTKQRVAECLIRAICDHFASCANKPGENSERHQN